MDQEELYRLRTTLAGHRDAADSALDAVAQAAADLDLARRTGTPEDVAAKKVVHDRKVEELAGAQATERGGCRALTTALGTFIGDGEPGTEVARLSTEYPIVLLPVRIETRFDLPAAPGKPVLRVRVYPDEIFADDFEKRLTRAEEAGGRAYWAPGAAQRAVWDDMASRFGGERAAWIIKKTKELAGPSNEYRPEAWTRAVEARALPDRWIVVGWPIGGTTPVIRAGLPIPEPLALTVNPNAPAADDGPVEDDVLWTVDYQRALEVGMAIDVPLDEPHGGRNGFSQLLVLGVKASLTPRHATDALTRLFAAHRFSRGFDFVAQGTPTNNTTERPSGYPPPDLADALYRVEAAVDWTTPVDGESDAHDFLDFLGVDRAEREQYETWRLVHAGRREQSAARNMNWALWPATWGYYLQHMMDVPGGTAIFEPDDVEDARHFFASSVRGCGPLPAFRIGSTPYGVLPISTLDGWVDSGSGVGGRLPAKLRLLREHWRAALGTVPRIGRNPANADADLIKILGQHPSTREVRVRAVIGQAAWHNILWLLRRASAPWTSAQRQRAREVFGSIGEQSWFPRVARTIAWLRTLRYREPIVGTEPLSEVTGPAQRSVDYIDWLSTHDALAIRADIPETGHPKNLLYRVLRHATLAEYARVGWEWASKNYPAAPRFFELFFGARNHTAIWTRLGEKAPGTDTTIAAWMATKSAFIPNHPGHESVRVYPPVAQVQALSGLVGLSDAELERLFTEALDLATYRIDAWITALFTLRLRGMRTESPD